MIPKFRSWWKDKVKPLEITGLLILLGGLIALVIVIIFGYIFNWGWAGLNGYNTVSTTIDITSSSQKITRTIGYQPEKTLWDWMQLLIIPVVLTIAGYLLNLTVSRNEKESTGQRDKTEHEISLDNQREAALQQYIDKLSELLLDKNLRESQPKDEVSKIARVRTLTVLPRLDAERKRSILLFLYESSLIGKSKLIIDLNDADLSYASLALTDLNSSNLIHADLSNANLSRANLSFTNLSCAKLNRTNLSDADFKDANLSFTSLKGAKLSNANLSSVSLIGANLSSDDLSGATITTKQLDSASSLTNTIMPDGSKHL